MSTSLPPILRICRFDGYGHKPYLCLHNEVCCREGCCLHQTYRFFNSWYFWLGLLVAFVLYRYASWYCQKVEQQNRDRLATIAANLQTNEEGSVGHLLPVYPSSRASSSSKCSEPPPQYSIAVNLPTPDDSVPSYEQAMKL